MVNSSDANLHLRILTPTKIVRDEHVISVTAPSADGEITVLHRHTNLFSYLKEGILKIKNSKGEDYYSIGGGILETDGRELNILVSRAYGQDEIDEKLTQEAIKKAETVIKSSKDKLEIEQAQTLLRRSVVDLKLLKKRKKVQSGTNYR